MNVADLTWPDVEKLSRDVPVVIPIAAMEQHGPHLPLFTDSLLLGEVVRRVSEVMQDRILFTPLMWLGNSEHHIDFPGTLSAAPRTYIDLLNDMMENLLRHGFRRVVLLNGHGGNTTPGKQAVFEIRQRHRARKDLLLLFANYWEASNARDGRKDFIQPGASHACEWETSMVLQMAPHLVKDIAHLKTIPSGSVFEPAHRAWTTNDLTDLGYIGSPQAGTAEKGEHLFRAFTGSVCGMLEQMIAWDGISWDTPPTV